MVLKRNYVIIVVVGIGEEVNIEELLIMVLIIDNFILVRIFKEFKKGIVRIRDKVCGGKLRDF